VGEGAPNIIIVADEDALARAVAERFLAQAAASLAARGSFFVSLAGGSTPKAAYALIASAYGDALDWGRVRFFFGDERCVPPDDDESNYKMANSRLFAPLGISASHVFRIRGEDEPAAAAAAYAETLKNEVPKNPEGTPAFDLVMLGLGPDGHTASLFPGSDPFEGDGLLVRAPFVEKFGTHRITLTPRVLNAATMIEVATAGPTKTAALAAVLEGPYDPRSLPAQVLRPVPGRLVWLVDAAAAADLGAAKPA
jgi:6-phosphogluconolactonase